MLVMSLDKFSFTIYDPEKQYFKFNIILHIWFLIWLISELYKLVIYIKIFIPKK